MMISLILLDSSIQKTGQALTLAYNQVDWLEQPFATKVENVNPFNVVVYNGIVKLQPEIDSWAGTIQLQDANISTSNRQTVDLNNTNENGNFDIVNTSTRNEVVRNLDEEFIRSGNVEFNASNLKPNTQDSINS